MSHKLHRVASCHRLEIKTIAGLNQFQITKDIDRALNIEAPS